MKKTFLIILGLVVVVALVGMYKFNYLASKSGYDVDGNKLEVGEKSTGYKNATYNIGAESVVLVDGSAETASAPDSAIKIVTKYFGNEVRIDLNNDDREDIVFLLTQTTGGTGTFFYAVAALNTEDGWLGSRGFYLGDRVAPQTTEISNNPNHQNVIAVNYADRAVGEAMLEQPSVGKSAWLKFDVGSMSFGEVEQNFSGEADPDVMTLDMQPWTWVKTSYNNDTELVPNKTDAFTIAFKKDGAVSVTTDCNSMGGTYSVTGNKISFGPMFSTMMFCENSQEQDFSSMLAEVQSYFFTSKGELILELKLDSGSATFR